MCISVFSQDSSIKILEDICGNEYVITKRNDCFAIISKDQYLGEILTPSSSSPSESVMLSLSINLCPIAMLPYEKFDDIAILNRHLINKISALRAKLPIKHTNTKDDPLDNYIPFTIDEKIIILEINLLKAGIRQDPICTLNTIPYWLDASDIWFDDNSVNEKYSSLLKDLSSIKETAQQGDAPERFAPGDR
jgi:hypothetical protein